MRHQSEINTKHSRKRAAVQEEAWLYHLHHAVRFSELEPWWECWNRLPPYGVVWKAHRISSVLLLLKVNHQVTVATSKGGGSLQNKVIVGSAGVCVPLSRGVRNFSVLNSKRQWEHNPCKTMRHHLLTETITWALQGSMQEQQLSSRHRS